jgi:hypothetical protein
MPSLLDGIAGKFLFLNHGLATAAGWILSALAITRRTFGDGEFTTTIFVGTFINFSFLERHNSSCFNPKYNSQVI